MNILDEQKERQKQFDNFSDDFRVCGGIDPLRDTSIDQANRTIANAAGVKRIRVHDFRHTFATIFLSFLLRFLQLFYSNINIFSIL